MARIYTEEELLRDHNKLNAEYKGKARRYILKLLQLQRAEQGLDRQIYKFTGSLAVDGPDIRCSFCGRTPEQVERMFSGPGVYICNECVDLCVEVTKELNEKETPENKQES